MRFRRAANSLFTNVLRNSPAHSVLAVILSTFSSSALTSEHDAKNIGTIAVTGTRHEARSVYDSPGAIDVIQEKDLRSHGTNNIVDMIRSTVPSFNANTQPIDSFSTLVRPAGLRGLPPDSTLFLLNNKRRHRASTIHWNVGNQNLRGSQGPDISVIPAIALKRVEVLHDGASAQYGSDAIAGVMNFILKDYTDGATLEVKGGRYSEDNNETAYTIAGNIGMPLTARGFINASFEYSEADDTSRSVQRADAQQLIDAGNPHVRNPTQIWGSPKINDELKTVFNLGLELDDNKKLYAFGNHASKEVDGSFYFRNPSTLGGGRIGVFVNSDKPGGDHLIAKLTPDADCSNVRIDPRGHIINNPNPRQCFSFNQRFPGGFTPRFGADLEDTSLVAGLRGELDNGLNYDLSASRGRHDSDFFIHNTVNASFGPDSPTSFDPGDYTQTEYHLNADFNYAVELDTLASDLNIASGLEYRVEEFEITAGEEKSWKQGPLAAQGFSVGSNGFPGFSENIAGKWDRENYAVYLDLQADVTERWTVEGALRFEDFDDFGTTTNGKLSSRFELTNWMSLRATWGTGFRAPTPGQSNASNISTVCGDDECNLVDSGVFPPSVIAAVIPGADQALDPEESTSWTTGLTFRGQSWDMTINYFNIKVDDRISLSKIFRLTDDDREKLARGGIAGASDIYLAQLFVNDIDTETKGIDVVITHSKMWNAGVTDINLAYNHTDIDVESYSPDLIDETVIRDIEDALPDSRLNATATHRWGNWNFLLRYNWTDEWYEKESGKTTFNSYWTIDVEAGYSFNSGVTLLLGSTNLTDETPDRYEGARQFGNRYAQYAPLGFNGAFYYGRLVYEF